MSLWLQASAMMVGGSLDFFPGVSAVRYLEGCQLYVVGSTIYLLLALFAAHEVCQLSIGADSGLWGSPSQISGY